MKKFIQLLGEKIADADIVSSRDLEKLKEKVSAVFGISPPSNADLRKAYLEALKSGVIEKNLKLERWLKAKRMRTASGVATVAVLTKDFPCHGDCLYCPTEKAMPKSYLSNEPAVMRAVMVGFDPYQQVQKRLEALELNGHSVAKIEIIVMGGTFSHLPEDYRYEFIKECFRACNEYGARNKEQGTRSIQGRVETRPIMVRRSWILECVKGEGTREKEQVARGKENCHFSTRLPSLSGGKLDGQVSNFQTISNDVIFNEEALFFEQTRNETAEVRVVGLTLETRPDSLDEEEIRKFRELGATRVEIGVQSVDDEVLKINRRGHTVEETIRATKLLKNAGFKVSYHMMLGLPGSSPKKDFFSMQKIFSDERFMPDLIKIYPCAVTPGSELFDLWKKGEYRPLSNATTEKLIIKIKKIIPPWVRVSRVIRDIPATSIVAGPNISNLRQLLTEKAKCRCIRCREIKKGIFNNDKAILRRTDYAASGGREIFLEWINGENEKLFSLLRLRLPGKDEKAFLPELKGAGLIRELHTYGKAVGLGKKMVGCAQHVGLGKKLMLEAERIVREESNFKKIAIIAGLGVREYYAKQGFQLEGSYMVKKIETFSK